MTEDILRQSGLPAALVDAMLDARHGSAEPCPVCGVGRGRWCQHSASTGPVQSPAVRRALSNTLPPSAHGARAFVR
jgi:hypothetical protein